MEHSILRSSEVQEQASAKAHDRTTGAQLKTNGKEDFELMKAVQMHGYGGIDQLRYEDVRDPKPGPD
jgi:hypothetical protein